MPQILNTGGQKYLHKSNKQMFVFIVESFLIMKEMEMNLNVGP